MLATIHKGARAMSALDSIEREYSLQEIAINDTGVIPLHFQVNLWATRDGIVYQPRTDEYTLATGVSKKK